MADERNTDYPPSASWDACEHDWRPAESMSGRDVTCSKCGCPGEEMASGEIYWPAT